MRRLLLGSTAIIGIAAFAQQANAEITVSLGGFVGFQAGFFTSDLVEVAPGDSSNDRDFQVESEVVVRADGEADNGLLYGVKLELQTSQNDQFNTDEAVIYLSGNWGRTEWGGEDGATDTMNVFAPTVGIGQIDGSFGDFIGSAGEPVIDAANTGDSTKITYYTPRFAGFQFGASYTPELNSEGENIINTDIASGTNTQEDIIELGLNYEGSFRDFSFIVSGGYAFGDTKTGAVDPDTGAPLQDIDAWVVGAQVGFGAFTVGGGYVDNGDSNAPEGVDTDGWNAGVSYATGPWGVAFNYANYERATADTDLYAVGASYTLAPGLIVSGDLGWFDISGDGGTDRDGFVGILETEIVF